MTAPLFRKFDVVQLLTVKHIKFVSGPKNRPASPHGNWSVVGFVKSDLMLAKDSTIVLAPPDSVRRVAEYDVEEFLKRAKGTTPVKKGAKSGQEGKGR
jgi:hypothetical protein